MSLREQYNLVPGNYAKEMASLSVLPHLKSMTAEVAAMVSNSISKLFSKKK